MSSDPTDWTTERLLRHAAEFFDLPLTSVAAVMDDVDIEAHNDLLYVRGLIEDLASAKAELQKEIKDAKAEHGQIPAEPLMWLQYLCHSAESWTPETLIERVVGEEERWAELVTVKAELARMKGERA